MSNKQLPTIQCLNADNGQNWAMFNGDCVEVVKQMPTDSVDCILYSPPFANVYTYSDSTRDMGNVTDAAEFVEGYRFLVDELLRVLRPGRMCIVHCKDTVRYKGSSGRSGLVDFPGMLTRAHEQAGFQYHSRVTLWTNPVREMQKTKAHGLLYKQLRKDSSYSRQGLPEYLVMMRKWPEDEDRASAVYEPVSHTRAGIPLDTWQEWASPVWMKWDPRDTLNVRAAREDGDEKHMCPLSLDIINRALTLWSNPGDVVLSPFGGVGSEGVGSLKLDRKFVGVELKDSYFRRACLNLRNEENTEQVGMFG
jgi:DNA modification methylase